VARELDRDLELCIASLRIFLVMNKAKICK
jgi:hypothetical protein